MKQRSIRIVLVVLVWCAVQLSAVAQEIKVTAGFVKDSVQLGEAVSFYLTARYPQNVMALFPDSTFTFSPFEFEGKQFFPTRTTDGTSYDSAVYQLSTFEIDPVQYLSLPVYVTTARDCTLYESVRDSIHLIEQIKIPASDTATLNQLTLKSNTLYERVFTEFNVLILMIVVTVLIAAILVTWIFFGKKIIRYFRLRKLRKKHQMFLTEYDNQFQDISAAFSREKTEYILSTWKKYLEQLEHKPFTKLTTREVKALENDPVMSEALSKIDNVIYGHQTSVNETLTTLQQIAEQRFTRKLEHAKHE